jgi:hypothetical protein
VKHLTNLQDIQVGALPDICESDQSFHKVLHHNIPEVAAINETGEIEDLVILRVPGIGGGHRRRVIPFVAFVVE